MDRAVVKIDRVPICERGYVQSIRLTGLLLRERGKKRLPRFMVVVLCSVNKKGRVLHALCEYSRAGNNAVLVTTGA
jgi:hypothetical protein